MQASHLWRSLSEQVRNVDLIFLKGFVVSSRLQSVSVCWTVFLSQCWTDCSFLLEGFQLKVMKHDRNVTETQKPDNESVSNTNRPN